jgi:hypothetical protein
MIDYWQNQRLEAIERALSWIMRDYADWQEPEAMPAPLPGPAPGQYQVPAPVPGAHQVDDHSTTLQSDAGAGIAEVKSRVDRLETTVMNLLNVVTVLNANLANRAGMQSQDGGASVRSRYMNGAIDQAQDRRIAALDAEVTKLQTSYTMLLADHQALQTAHAKLKGAGRNPPPHPTSPSLKTTGSASGTKPSSILKSRSTSRASNPVPRPSGPTTSWSKP